MTISNINYRDQYTGDGSTSVFAYTFKILDESHVKVVLTDVSGVDSVLTLTTDYSVSGVDSATGGNITLVTAPASGEKLTIVRNIPSTQLLDLQDGVDLDEEALEEALDKLTMKTQELEEKIDRCAQVQVSETAGDYLDDCEMAQAQCEALVNDLNVPARTVYDFVAGAGDTTFSCGFKSGQTSVFINGLLQKEGTSDSYTGIEDTSITFNEGLISGDEVTVHVYDKAALTESITFTGYSKSELDGGQLDNRYYTETEMDTALSDKADSANVYSKTEVDGLFSGLASGNILQVVETPYTAAYTSTVSNTWSSTPISASITPTSASSKILVMCMPTMGGYDTDSHIRLTRNGSSIFQGDSDGGSRVEATIGNWICSINSSAVETPFLVKVDTPGTTSQVTYALQHYTRRNTFCINRSGNDSNDTQHGRYVSNIVLIEIGD